jgi:hypothetical protein
MTHGMENVYEHLLAFTTHISCVHFHRSHGGGNAEITATSWRSWKPPSDGDGRYFSDAMVLTAVFRDTQLCIYVES